MRSPKERTDGRAARSCARRPSTTSVAPPVAALLMKSRSALFTIWICAAAGLLTASSATATKLITVSAFMKTLLLRGTPRGEAPQEECHRGAVQWRRAFPPGGDHRAREPPQNHLEARRNSRQRVAIDSDGVHGGSHGASGLRLADR